MTISADPTTEYAKDVVAGQALAGPHVRAACQRHLDDLKTAKSRGLKFDRKKAAKALGFFPDVLRLSEGQFDGKPFELHPSQAFIVGSLFGWVGTDGTRRFRRAYIEQGKGNGKSPLVGGIGLFGMMADHEPGAQVFAAAAKMDQARILFNDAVAMVRQSPPLERRITMSGINPVNNMADLKTGSYFRPVGRDTGKTGSGLRPHFALLDELHEHPNRDTLEMLERGFKFRRQPLLVMITNSGSDLTSVCREEHDHAVAVSHGRVEDDTTFAYVCALDEDDDPLTDPTCWPKANPLLGVTLTEKYLHEVAAQARAIPGKANNIRRLHFCQWTEAETAWLDRAAWEKCIDTDLALDEFEGQECWYGLDLSASRDFTARAMLFRDGWVEVEGENKPAFALFGHAYLPADTMQRRLADKEINQQVPAWIELGHMTATPGKLINHGIVARDLVEMAERFPPAAVAYDTYLYSRMSEALDDIGAVLPVMEHPQGFPRRKDTDLWMPQSVNDFEELIIEGRLRVANNGAMTAAVLGATIEESAAGLRRFVKIKTRQSKQERIDLCVAGTMAVGAASLVDHHEDGDMNDYFASLGAAHGNA